MRRLRLGQSVLGALCAVAALGGVATPAQGAASDPLFVYVPTPPPPFTPVLPPPVGYFSGPCGIGVDSAGRFYVSDYYHHAIDVFKANDPNYKNPSNSPTGYITQIADVDPLDGPCGLAFDGSDNLYVNNYHRNVVKYAPFPSFGSPTTIAGVGVDSTHPTGVDVDPATGNVYVDHRTYVAVYDSSGAAVEEGGKSVKVGDGTLENGYGVALSQFPGTAGRLYVPDATTNTVKVYDPATDKVNPVAEIDGSGTPNGEFVSLRDSAVAVDRVSGEIYVIDNLQPQYTEKPQAIVYVFDSAGTYIGHLKYKIVDALPPGLAVDNNPGATHPTGTQGRVYVTSGNTELAGVYAYPPGAATTSSPLPPSFGLTVRAGGSGHGTITSTPGDLACSRSCEAEIRSGAQVALTATPAAGSTFSGWSGACSDADETCTLTMDEAASVTAGFKAVPPPPTPLGEVSTGPPTSLSGSITSSPQRVRRHRARRHHRAKHRRKVRQRRSGARHRLVPRLAGRR